MTESMYDIFSSYTVLYEVITVTYFCFKAYHSNSLDRGDESIIKNTPHHNILLDKPRHTSNLVKGKSMPSLR